MFYCPTLIMWLSFVCFFYFGFCFVFLFRVSNNVSLPVDDVLSLID